MPDINTRHAERKHLYSLYEAALLNDLDNRIMRAEAAMEQEDIDAVRKKVNELKSKLNLQ